MPFKRPFIPLTIATVALLIAAAGYLWWGNFSVPDPKKAAGQPEVPRDVAATVPSPVQPADAAAPVSILTKNGDPPRIYGSLSSLMSAALPPLTPSELAAFPDRMGRWKAAHDQLIAAIAARKIAVPETSGDIDPNIARLLGMNWGLDLAQELDDPIAGPMLRELLSDSKFFVAARERLNNWAQSPQFESHLASAKTPEELIASIKAMAESYRPHYEQKVSAMNIDPEVAAAVADYSRSQLTGALFQQYLAAHNLRLTPEGFAPAYPNDQLPPKPRAAER